MVTSLVQLVCLTLIGTTVSQVVTATRLSDYEYDTVQPIKDQMDATITFNSAAPEWKAELPASTLTAGSSNTVTVTTTKKSKTTTKKSKAVLCRVGATGRSQCGDVCICQALGKWKCCRFRFEMTRMAEHAPRLIKAWMDTYKKARFHPLPYLPYRELTEVHRRSFTGPINQMALSMPWHRWYLLNIEQMLQLFDCRITLPYLDWGEIANNWDTSLVWTDKVLGGTGNKASHSCLTSGPFNHYQWRLTPDAHSSCKLTGKSKCCLQRSFGKRAPLAQASRVETILKIPPKHYPRFLAALDAVVVMPIHINIGGTMATHDAAQAPEYALSRAYADYIWWRYLRQSPLHHATAVKFHGSRILPWSDSNDTLFPVLLGTKAGGVKASDMVNSQAQGVDKVCVTYEWSHGMLSKDKKLPTATVASLANDMQWTVFEAKANKATIAELREFPAKKQGSYKNLHLGFKLFGTPAKERKMAMAALKYLVKETDAVSASKLNAKNAVDQLSGLDMEDILG